MFEALTRLYEGKNINKKMTLRTQLKNVKMQKSETIHSYFTRVSQINGHIEATGDKVEATELVMTTPNGLPSSKGCAQERSSQSSIGYGKNAHKKKPYWKPEKRS